jgi:hypothetical protein
MDRSGQLHVTKECSAYQGRADDFCTIVSSNLDEIGAGSRVVYAMPAGDGKLSSDISLDCGASGTATGHVELDLGSGTGQVTFAGGTGAFAGFNASAEVSADAAGAWHWEGTYSLSPAPEAVAT